MKLTSPGQGPKTSLRNLTRKGLAPQTHKSFSYRIKFLPREKASYGIMRRVGCRIHHIAKFWGRSTSVVWKVLKVLETRGVVSKDVWGRTHDLRKMPHKTRMRLSSFRWALMNKLREAWERFALGEGEKPP